jgi:hypothetical protein
MTTQINLTHLRTHTPSAGGH